MPHASSPISFPSSPSARAKRKPEDAPARSQPRVQGGFVVDDDSSDDDDVSVEPPTKKRMVDSRPASRGELASGTESRSASTVVESEIPSALSSFLVAKASAQTSFSSFSPFKIRRSYTVTTCSGKSTAVKERPPARAATYESMVAARSKTKEGRARRAYYGIDLHELVDAAKKELAEQEAAPAPVRPDVPVQTVEPEKRSKRSTMLWTEKYRARAFMDLCGDDGTNRTVLRWLKRWDPLVFPGAAKSRPVIARRPGLKQAVEEEKPHRKILMLTGPPGLGKTTLAHVCARQAGYEVMEINASDDRSRDVVKNRIRTSLGTESVKNVGNSKAKEGEKPKVARPVCVVVDEVDGVVSGAGASGEGGFVKALIDLVLLDQKNGSSAASNSASGRKKKKGDDFRLMRPLILICNDVYHPSLRPLRQSNLAEIIHVGKPGIDAVVNRLKTVFEKEGIPCEKDAARKLCETAWGMASGIDAKRGAESTTEGDLRGVMVVGEWVAGRIRTTPMPGGAKLTRQWLEQNVLQDLANGGGGGRGLGRGGVRDIVARVFQEGGGFPRRALDTSSANPKNKDEQPKTQLGFSEYHKKNAMEQLRHMVDSSGDVDRIMSDIFSEYPNREFNDDSYLTKPNDAYEWLHFHDSCSARLFGNQDWELGAYLSQPVLACHHLFASPIRHKANMGYDKKWGQDAAEEVEAGPPVPFSGPRASFEAHEAEKHNRAQLQALQAQLTPTLMRSFRSPEDVATDFLPYLVRMLAPEVKPVVVGGSGEQKGTASVRREAEKVMVQRSTAIMAEIGITLQRGKIEGEAISRGPQWVYRMEPDLDALATFETGGSLLALQAPTRYAVRQVLDQELQKTLALLESAARQARFTAGRSLVRADEMVIHDDKENKTRPGVKEKEIAPAVDVRRDFFGRVIQARPLGELDANSGERKRRKASGEQGKEVKVWVTFHEGLNNAVRKPISLREFMRGF